MKFVIPFIICLFALNSYAQTSEAITEEKSSAWVKVIENPVAVSKPASSKKQPTTVKKKSSKTKPATPKPDVQEEFEKTNQQVNRFRKQKKG